MQEQPLDNNLAPSVKRKGKKIAAGVIILVIVIAVILFLPYKGLPNLLGISKVSANSPYQNVNSIQQLSYATEKTSNSSGPFNISYDFTLQLKAKTGPLNLSFNLPIKGFVEHYSPVTRETADIYLVDLEKQVATLSASNLSSLPPAFDILNLTVLENSTGGELCVPFSFLAESSNQSVQSAGLLLNDTSITNSSLFCVSINDKNIISNPISLLNSVSSLNISQLNASEISGLNNSLSVKFVNNTVYNGNKCSLISINTTNSFEKEYNASFGFDLCFSDSYGTALYGNFLLNLTKDTSIISSFLSSSGAVPPLSSLIIAGSLTSSFEKPPVSLSSVSSLPIGSYSANLTKLLKSTQPSIQVSSSGFSPLYVNYAVCNSSGTFVSFVAGGLPDGATSATLDNITLTASHTFSTAGATDSFPAGGIFSTPSVSSGSSFEAIFPETICSSSGASFNTTGSLYYTVTTSTGPIVYITNGVIAGISS